MKRRIIDFSTPRVLQPLPISVSMPMKCRAPRLPDLQPYAFARGRVSLVILRERVHRAVRRPREIHEGERMISLKARELPEIGVP